MARSQIDRAIIIHGYLGNSGKHWFPSLASDLTAAGISTHAVDLPRPDEPDLGRWLDHLTQSIGRPDEDLLLVTHSLGGLAAAAYLGSLSPTFTLGALLAVAPFYQPLSSLPELDRFISDAGGASQLTRVSGAILQKRVVRSNNDPYVPVEHAERYAQHLRATVTVDGPAEHFFDPTYPSITKAARTLVHPDAQPRHSLDAIESKTV